MTDFQEKCVGSIKELFGKKMGLQSIEFKEMVGRKENYLKAKMKSRNLNPVDIFVYLDEAGFMFNEKEWLICERADFQTEDDLIKAFIIKLETVLDM